MNKHMRKKALNKSIFRDIKGSFGRFFAIFAIIALGVGFFSGVKITTPILVHTIDNLYKENNLFNYKLVSTLGWEENDVENVRSRADVKYAEGAFQYDIICLDKDNKDIVFKAYSLTENINGLMLRDGRLPESADEVLLDNNNRSGFKIGDTVQLSPSNDEDSLKHFKNEKYTVVGFADSSLYINFERGNTSLGNGVVNGFMYLTKDAFDEEIYTEIYVSLFNDDDLYSDEYKDTFDEQRTEWEEINDEAALQRYDRIYDEASEEIADARETLEEEKADAEKELRDAKKELDDGKKDLDDAAKEIADGEKELEDAETELRDARNTLINSGSQLDSAKSTLDSSGRELSESKDILDDSKEQLDDSKDVLDASKKQLDESKETLDASDKKLGDSKAVLDASKKELDESKAQLDAAKEELDENESVLASSKEILDSSKAQLDAAKKELDNTKATLESASAELTEKEAALTSAENDLDMAETAGLLDAETIAAKRAELAEGWAALEAAKSEYEEGLAQWNEGNSTYNASLSQYEAGLAEYNAGLSAWNEGKAQYEAGLAQWEAGLAEYEAGLEAWSKGKAEFEAGLAAWNKGKSQYDTGLAAWNEGKAQYEAGLAQWENGKLQYEAGLAQYEQGLAKYNSGWASYYSGLNEFNDGKKELEDGKAEYEDGLKEYNDGLREYEDGVKEFNEKIADAEEELADAEAELADLDKPETFLLERNTNIAYSCFESDSSIVEQVARVFPIFFILVAALVCMTTMTRMVEEQRGQIGTLKALGYSNGSILKKFVIYSGSAALLGCITGYAICIFIFPYVIWTAYKMMYISLPLIYIFDWKLALISLIVSLGCSVGTTYISCRYELSETAASLMRPKAPKAGRRVFLEYIPFIWNRLKFLHKVSIRNILRYKRRFFMMIVGISGCTALLLTGFGMKDSVAGFAEAQYDNIQTADIELTFKNGTSDKVPDDIIKKLEAEAVDYTLFRSAAWDLITGDHVKGVNLISPYGQYEVSDKDESSVQASKCTDDFNRFFRLTDKSGNPLNIPAKGEALVSIGLAERYGIHAGDSITLRDEDMNEIHATVSGIFENHVYNYVIVSPEDLTTELNGAYVNYPEKSDIHNMQASLSDCEDTVYVTVFEDFKNRMTKMMSSLNYVVLIVILSAAGLAFVVLYNLTNINITERIREIATLKVLGFYQNETAQYVFRENIVLTFLGMLVGLGLGILLHRFVMAQIIVDMVHFKVNITPLSYVYSIVLTFLFTFLVNLVMRRKLEKINMAESLKSVE